MKSISIENTVRFRDIEEFYLPKNCLICGDETENRIEKSEYGSYTSTKDYKNNYKFKLPICDECNSNINLKAGKSGIILWLSVIFGIILGIMVYYLTYSIILSVAVFIVLFIFPYLNYRAKIRPRIKLSDFLHMKVIPNENLVQFTFFNNEYARYVNKINSEKIEAERIEAERIEAERIEAERIKAERIKAEIIEVKKLEEEKIKEIKKSETVEKIPTLVNGKSYGPIQAKNFIVDGNIAANSVIPPTKDISKSLELTDIPAIKEIPPVTKKCPKCGSELKPSWKFCVFCSEIIKV